MKIGTESPAKTGFAIALPYVTVPLIVGVVPTTAIPPWNVAALGFPKLN